MPCLACGSSAVVDGPRKGRSVYRRCICCELLSCDPIPTPSDIEAHYRSKFDCGNYEVARRYAAQYRRVHEQLAGWVEVRRGERLLDVGCFTGDLLEILAQRGADVNGLELQPEAVETANRRLGGRVFQADILGVAFPTGPYDVITMMGLIEHVIDPRATIRRAYQLLVPGGRIYLQTPNAGSRLARALGRAWPPLAPVEHVHIFSARAITTLLEDEGFAGVRTRAHVKRLPVSYVHDQLASFGGRSWQRAASPFKMLLGDASIPFYGGEMFVSAKRV